MTSQTNTRSNADALMRAAKARPLQVGTAVRFADDEKLIVEGYLVRFWTGDTVDTYYTRFDADTDYNFRDWPVVGLPLLVDHGMDDDIGMRAVGRVISADVDKNGIKIKAKLDEREEYLEMIREMVEKGAYDFSGAAHQNSVRVNEDTRHMDQWCYIESSMTHTPGDWRGPLYQADGVEYRSAPTPSIQPLHLWLNGIEAERGEKPKEPVPAPRSTRAQADGAPATSGENLSEEQIQGRSAMTPEEITALAKALASEMTAQDGNRSEDEDVAADAIADKLREEEETREGTPEPLTQEKVQELIAHAQEIVEERRAVVRDGVRAALKNAPGKSRAESAGGHRSSGADTSRNAHVSVGEERQFAGYSTADMAMALKLTEHQQRRAGMRSTPFDGLPEDMREAFIRTFLGRVADDINGSKPVISRRNELSAVRSAIPWRAGEIDASTVVGKGAEWISTYYDSVLWEKTREELIFSKLVAHGMQAKEIGPNGKAVFFAEGDDPEVYASPEAKDLDSTGRPEVTAKINPFSTRKIEMEGRELKLATSYTVRLNEQSLLNVAAAVNNQITNKLNETISALFPNGDTETGANTNINLIDGTPANGLVSPYYLAADGFLKQALVTNSAQSYASSAFNTRAFLKALQLMPTTMRSRRKELAYLIDSDTYIAALDLAVHLTDAERNAGGTWLNGEFTKAWGVDVIETGLMSLANSAGKVSATPSNNTRGRIACVWAPGWAFAFQRNLTIETERDILSGTEVFVGSVVIGLESFNNRTASVVYDLPVNI